MFLFILFGFRAYSAPECTDILGLYDTVWGGHFLKGYVKRDFSKRPATVGIELEGLIPIKYKHKDVIEYISERILIYDPPKDVIFLTEDQFSYVDKNGSVKTYTAKSDNSITTTPGTFGIELTSPILESNEDINIYYSVLDAVKNKFQLKPDPVSSGTHIHVGFSNPNTNEKALLLTLFKKIESQLLTVFPISGKRRYQYIAAVSKKITMLLNVVFFNSLSKNEKHKILDGEGEYQVLNLLQKKYKTAEFRLFNSTWDSNKIYFYVDFSKKFIEAVGSKDPRLIAYLKKYKDSEKFPLGELAQTLEIDLPKQPGIPNPYKKFIQLLSFY